MQAERRGRGGTCSLVLHTFKNGPRISPSFRARDDHGGTTLQIVCHITSFYSLQATLRVGCVDAEEQSDYPSWFMVRMVNMMIDSRPIYTSNDITEISRILPSDRAVPTTRLRKKSVIFLSLLPCLVRSPGQLCNALRADKEVDSL